MNQHFSITWNSCIRFTELFFHLISSAYMAPTSSILTELGLHISSIFPPFSWCPPSLFFLSLLVWVMMAITWRRFFIMCICVRVWKRARQWMGGVNVSAIISLDWLWVALSAGSIPTASLCPQEQQFVCLCMCAMPFVNLCVCACADVCLFVHSPHMPYKLQNHSRASRRLSGFNNCNSPKGCRLKVCH